MKNIALFFSFAFFFSGAAQSEFPSGVGLDINSIYKASYALVVGVSAYQKWEALPNVLKETDEVVGALKEQGFVVRYVRNPRGDELQAAFRDFFADYGGHPDHRLIVYYGGHGHSIGDSAYLVPIDAPDPKDDEPSFLRKAQSMGALAQASREYRARHALYVFDSCFSGAIFSTRSTKGFSLNSADLSLYLAGPASYPVRQFITAGSEVQRVPQISFFTPLFIKGIRGEVSELNRGGFVSAKELGLWLARELRSYKSNQTPLSGTLLDPRFDRGDLVFNVRSRLKPIQADQVVYPPEIPSVTTQCFEFNNRVECQ